MGQHGALPCYLHPVLLELWGRGCSCIAPWHGTAPWCCLSPAVCPRAAASGIQDLRVASGES